MPRSPRRSGRALRTLVALVCALAMAATATACSSSQSNTGTDTFSFGSQFGIPSFDPIKNANPFANVFLYPVYDRLVHLSPEGDLVPGLATKWEFSPDATALTLSLRSDSKFTDGQVVDAESVKVNLERSRDTPTSTVAGALKGITSVDVVDTQTVVLRLAKPDVSLPGTLAERAGMMISPVAIATGTLDTVPVGAGQYSLVRYVDNDRAVYDRRDDAYWDGEAAGTETLEIRIFTDNQARVNALRTGEINAASVEAPNVADFDKNPGFGVDAAPVMSFFNMFFASPVFEDSRVRKAISLAIDRQAINDVVFNGISEPLSQEWPSNYFAYADGLSTDRNVDEARKLLTEAGVTNLVFTAQIPALDPHPKYAVMIQSMLEDIGVTMNIAQVDPSQNADIFFNQKRYDALLSAFPANPDPLLTVAQIDVPSGFYNRSQWTEPEVVSLYEKAKTETDEQARIQIIKDLARATNQYATSTPLLSALRPYVYSTQVEGWQHYASGTPEFRGIKVVR